MVFNPGYWNPPVPGDCSLLASVTVKDSSREGRVSAGEQSREEHEPGDTRGSQYAGRQERERAKETEKESDRPREKALILSVLCMRELQRSPSWFSLHEPTEACSLLLEVGRHHIPVGYRDCVGMLRGGSFLFYSEAST
ncbi:hypothetical protein NDU88_001103 [Pleurodeles waltl]|uniref:Uncharacterized protein n=1 Tax=Pleurodeles waltl TaxID=8319 RepID=A0AAV7S8X2_PLEWA|nr:hypothetical protein NDU88_001103 [Pleurodeles waltl]